MSLKPIAPKKGHPIRRGPGGMPVVIVEKKKSGSGSLILGLLLLVALGGGGFVYYNQQKNEAALAAKQQRLEQNARNAAVNERLRAEAEEQKRQKKEAARTTALGSVGAPAAESTPAPKTSRTVVSTNNDAAEAPAEEEEEGPKSAMGSTSAPTAGDGVFNVDDTSAAPFDLTAEGKAAKAVITKLDKAIDAAGDGDTFHDLQADLKRSFEVAQPGAFADASTLPPFPDKEHKLLRMAQGVYVCLNLAAELDARNTVPSAQHAKFVNWLMKDKAKAARTFTYGLEHYNIHDVARAADLLDEVRQAYLISPSSGMKKIPVILKAAGEK